MADDEDRQAPIPAHSVPAESLHHHVDDVRLRKERHKSEELRHQEEEARHAYFEFMNRKFTEADERRIEDITGNAVHAGEYEVEILRFPAWYLPDKGRAINNGEENWPASLCGYAARLYEAYDEIGKPLGYRLAARVLDYPRGMIGDIAIYLRW